MDPQASKTELQRHLEGAGTAIDEGRGHAAGGEDLASKVKSASERVSEAAGGVYDSARHYARAVRADAAGNGVTVSGAIESHPIVALLVAGAIGYALGWMVHGRASAVEGEPLPDYARKWN